MFSVVIPTRNRSDLLTECLEAILSNSIKPNEIIVIDSSDPDKRKEIENVSGTIEQQFTEIKSAAKQRNIGQNKVSTNCDYVAFLDDDVIVPENYFSKLISSMEKYGYVGISGLAINFGSQLTPKQRNRIPRLIARLFLLDSNKNGVVLSSGVNIPVKLKTTIPIPN